MGELTIKDITRTGHVVRWQIVRTIRKQTLAEHLFMVTIISMELAERIFKYKCLRDSNRLRIMNWALRHDLPELYTGDISTPIKNKIKGINPNILDEIERDSSEKYSDAKDEVTGKVWEYIVKMADLLDGISFLRTEGLGEHANIVIGKLQVTYMQLVDIAKIKFDDLNWEAATEMYIEITEGNDTLLEFEMSGSLFNKGGNNE